MLKEDFQELCKKHMCYIIKYKSIRFKEPIYTVWFSDLTDNEDDKLVVDLNDSIIASHKISILLKYLFKNKQNLNNFKTKNDWIEKCLDNKTFFEYEYNIDYLREKLRNQNIDQQILSETVNFINLYQDYCYQTNNEDIFSISKTKELQYIWNFYYDNILFTGNGQKNKNLKIDFEKSLEDLNKLTSEFENHILLLENSL